MCKELRTYRFDKKTIAKIENMAVTLGVDKTEIIKRAVNTFSRLVSGTKNGYADVISAKKGTVNTVPFL